MESARAWATAPAESSQSGESRATLAITAAARATVRPAAAPAPGAGESLPRAASTSRRLRSVSLTLLFVLETRAQSLDDCRIGVVALCFQRGLEICDQPLPELGVGLHPLEQLAEALLQ